MIGRRLMTNDSIYHLPNCPKHRCIRRKYSEQRFGSMPSMTDKYNTCFDHYLNSRIATIAFDKTSNSNDLDFGFDESDDNYEDFEDSNNETNYEYNEYNDQYFNTNTDSVPNCCLQFWYCFSVSEKYKQQMKKRRVRGQGFTAANSVSLIDKTSRILFPFVFILLNIFYWGFYIIERNSEFKMWLK